MIGCSNDKLYVGSTYSGFDDFPNTKISVQKAIELSEPYLEKTFELRKVGRDFVPEKQTDIWVTLKNNWFYVVKDNYPSYTPGFYMKHAVKIHSDTGEIIQPN